MDQYDREERQYDRDEPDRGAPQPSGAPPGDFPWQESRRCRPAAAGLDRAACRHRTGGCRYGDGFADRPRRLARQRHGGRRLRPVTRLADPDPDPQHRLLGSGGDLLLDRTEPVEHSGTAPPRFGRRRTEHLPGFPGGWHHHRRRSLQLTSHAQDASAGSAGAATGVTSGAVSWPWRSSQPRTREMQRGS